MQKKFIALAVAGLVSGAAFAQSNVTIYGVADVGVEYANAGNGGKFRVQSGQAATSRLGFKGEEALGNGLKLNWVLEQGFSMDNGTQTDHSSQLAATAGSLRGTNTGAGQTAVGVFQRQANVGLSGSFGSVTIGRQYAPNFYSRLAADPFGLGTSATTNNILNVAGTVDRLDNSIMYMTPNFSGFQAALAYSTGAEHNIDSNTNKITSAVTTPCTNAALCASEDAGKAWSALLTYKGYNAEVAFNYTDVKGLSNLASYNADVAANNGTVAAAATSLFGTDVAKSTNWLLSGNYDFKVAKVFAAYASGKTKLSGYVNDAVFTGGDVADQRAWTLGVSVPFGAHKVSATYGQKNDKTALDRDYKQFGMGYNYTMSKRTDLYAAYAKASNDKQGVQALNTAYNTGLAATAGYDGYAVNLGVRHAF